MELNPIIDNPAAEADEKEMKLNADDKRYLLSTAKWTEFLCIVMFISIGLVLSLMLILMLSLGFTSYAATGSVNYGYLSLDSMWPLMTTYTVLFLIYIAPTVYMYRFARKAKRAIAWGDESEMTASLKNLRASVKFYGIMIIASIVLAFVMFMVLLVRDMFF